MATDIIARGLAQRPLGLLYSPAANTIEQRNGATAQAFRVYNTYTDASNYERGIFDFTTAANRLSIGSVAAGTGTQRSLDIFGVDILFKPSIGLAWYITSGGHFMGGTDNTYDIGASGATRPRNVHAGTAFILADGVTAPSATVGSAKLYVDVADGDLKVIFGDGVIKTLATDT